MGKLKTILTLLLAGALIAAFAYLPNFIAAYQDRSDAGSPGYAEIQPLQLQLGETRGELPIEGKLALLLHGVAVEVEESEASMLTDTVEDCVVKGLTPYLNLGLVPEELPYTDLCMTPFLVFSTEDPDVRFIYWSVDIVNGEAPYNSLHLMIDDETGKILRIDYYAENWYYDQEERYYWLDTFFNIYMDELGLTRDREILEEMDVNVEIFTEDISTDDAAGIRYACGDQIYGEIVVEFYCHPRGFYNLFIS